MEIHELAAVAATLRDAFERPDTDRAIEEFGWLEMVDEFEAEAVSTLFTAQGVVAGNSSALAQIVARPLLRALGITDHSVRPAVVLPDRAAANRLIGDAAQIDGVALDGADSSVLLAGVDESGRTTVVLADWKAPRSLGHGMDRALPAVRLAEGRVDLRPQRRLSGPDAEAALEAAVAAGRRALAHELNGVMLRMIELATEHATVRTQFGVRIGSYQAVQHRLAEARVRFQGSWDAAEAAWDTGDAHSALLAKALAGRTLRFVAAQCQQVLAGMGFTAEHFFSTLFRHGLVRDQLLGSGTDLRTELGRAIIAQGAVLPLPALGLEVTDSLARIDLFRTA